MIAQSKQLDYHHLDKLPEFYSVWPIKQSGVTARFFLLSEHLIGILELLVVNPLVKKGKEMISMKEPEYTATLNVRMNLRYWREERRFTVRALAAALGVSPTSVSDWERGVRSIHVERLEQIAYALDVPMETFLMVPPSQHSGELSPSSRRP